MVITFCKGNAEGDGNDPYWLAKRTADGRLTLWNMLVEEPETPANAAARAINAHFWSPRKAAFAWSDMTRVGSTETSDYLVQVFYVSKYLKARHEGRELLKHPDLAEFVHFDMLELRLRDLTPTALHALDVLEIDGIGDSIRALDDITQDIIRIPSDAGILHVPC